MLIKIDLKRSFSNIAFKGLLFADLRPIQEYVKEIGCGRSGGGVASLKLAR